MMFSDLSSKIARGKATLSNLSVLGLTVLRVDSRIELCTHSKDHLAKYCQVLHSWRTTDGTGCPHWCREARTVLGPIEWQAGSLSAAWPLETSNGQDHIQLRSPPWRAAASAKGSIRIPVRHHCRTDIHFAVALKTFFREQG